MSKAWLYQKADDVDKLGADAAPWLVGWLEPDGRRRSKTCESGARGKKVAKRLAAKITAELMTGTYEMKSRVLWDDFVREYDRRVLSGLGPDTRRLSLDALRHFERHVRPARVFAIDTGHVDDFITRRRQDPGHKGGTAVSPATVNKDLRRLRAALNVAVDWGYLKQAPRFRWQLEPKKLPRYVTPEHFAALYRACDAARMPRGLPYPAADWWRALLVFGYMTGWRVGDMLSLRREDLDLDGGYAVTRAEDNKGGRDDRVKLPPALLEHVRGLASFERLVFPWPHDRRTLYAQFARVQDEAGINLPCRERHDHTPACRRYGFHDLRRAFATMNAARLTPDALQQLMRHKSYLTTQVYINLARQLDEAADVVYVPDVLRERRNA